MTPFIIAEMSCNHLGSIDRAYSIIRAAAAAGADGVKLQTWSPDTMCIDRGYMLTTGPWAGRTLHSLYREAWTPWTWHEPLFDYARKLGLIPFSAAFDCESVDFLETLGVDRHKVASFELTDLPLIRYMASKGKPMILSTGMATEAEIVKAVEIAGSRNTTVLACTSAYPAPPADANLLLWARMLGPWGLSDHSEGIGVAVTAVALGAEMIEKHLTLSRADGGPDAGFSMEPYEFRQMVTECRRAAEARGDEEAKFGPGPNESTDLRRSLWITKDIAPGEPFRLGYNIATARPALGLSPATDLTSRVAKYQLAANTPLVEGMLA